MNRLLIVPFIAVLGLSACNTAPFHRQYLVFFQADSAALTPDGQAVVANVAQVIHTLKAGAIEVEGQADGGTAHDATLADTRSLAVINALKNAGVDPKRIVKDPSIPAPGQDGVVAHKVVVTLSDKPI